MQQQVELISSIDAILRKLPSCVMGCNQKCVNKIMRFFIYGSNKITKENKHHKKMNCRLYGTDVADENENFSDLEGRQRSIRMLRSSENLNTSIKEFMIPDKIMILIYERNKEYVYSLIYYQHIILECSHLNSPICTIFILG